MNNVKPSIKTSGVYLSAAFFAAFVGISAIIYNFVGLYNPPERLVNFQDSKFGNYLAAQHAIYVNDFDSAAKFLSKTDDKTDRLLANFLSGKSITDADSVKNDMNFSNRMIYQARLAQIGDWKKLYEISKKDESPFFAPIRIWSGVAVGKTQETFAFVKKLTVNESWKSFVTGQIYANEDQFDKAAEQFAKVSPDFINLNDYMYLLAFYKHANMLEKLKNLQNDFTSRPGGIFTLEYKLDPDFAEYKGNGANLAFGLLQSVSHSQALGDRDISIIMLRIASYALDNKLDGNMGIAINYYIGNYFYATGGKYWKTYFDMIPKQSPFYPFVLMKFAENTGNYNEIIKKLESITRDNSLFMPAVTKLVSKNLQGGQNDKALEVIDRTLKNNKLIDGGRSFILKTRAGVYLRQNELDKAQKDIFEALKLTPNDAGLMNVQARIWIARGDNLNQAYTYAIALIKKYPSDLEYWDTLGLAVQASEGDKAALEVYERVAKIAITCSSLFEHIGDIYADLGKKEKAKEAYKMALNLSEDGLVSAPLIDKKLQDLK